MMYQRQGRDRIVWSIRLLAASLLAGMLLGACQSTPAASPTAAPAAPTKAAAVAPTAAPAAPATAATAVPATKEVSVKIGHLPAFTGPLAADGEASGKAVNDYLQYVNDQGGLAFKDPKTGQTMRAKLDVTFEDTGYDATRALNIYQRQKAAGVKAILSLGGTIIGALADPVSKDKIPALVSGAPSEASLKPTPRYMMTSSGPYNRLVFLFLKYVKDNWKESRPPRFGMTFFDSPGGIVGTVGVPEYAKQIGWDVLPLEAIAEPVTDSSIQMKRLLGGKPDYVYTMNTAGGTAVMMKDTARLGLLSQAQWVITGPSWNPETFQKVAPAETNGLMAMGTYALSSETNLPGVQMAEAISRKYQNVPLTNEKYMEQIGMAAVMVQGGIKGALEKVGPEALTGEAVRDALINLKNLDIGGLYPSVSSSEAKPWFWNSARLIQWKDNKTVVSTNWLPIPD